MAERHVVTGAFGFSGKYIARKLLEAGQDVLALTNSPERANPFKGKVKAIPFNFEHPDALAESLRGTGVLYNNYWVRFNYPGFSYSDAVKNSLTLFEAAKKAGVRRVVHISITNPSEDSPLEYFSGKARLEKALIGSGLSYAILRPAVIFGKEDILINNIRDEIEGLMSELLYTDSPPAGKTKLSGWLRRNRSAIGVRYSSELKRRKNRSGSYDEL